MDVTYLRVKNWGTHQHYRDKEPGWIKVYAKALRDNRFLELDELTQWQLVRLWMMASQSSRFTLDEDGRRVPVLVDDEQSLRRLIGTLRRIPLSQLVRDGWLLVVNGEGLEEVPDAVPDTAEPSPALDGDYTESRPSLEPGKGDGPEAAVFPRRKQGVFPNGKQAAETPVDNQAKSAVQAENGAGLSRPRLGSSRAGARTRGNREAEELKKEQDPSAEQNRSSLPAAALPNEIDLEETEPGPLVDLDSWGADLERRLGIVSKAPFGTVERLFEVLPDMAENSDGVLRELVGLVPAAAVEHCREEVLAMSPRRPTAYAVRILQARAAKARGAA